jgi:hypothetical protein
LLFRIDLPNDKLSQAIVKSVLVALADKFDVLGAKIDRSVHNASRISKLPGSWVRKGPSTPERPHRLARIVSEPDAIEAVTIEQLKAIGDPPVSIPIANGVAASPFAAMATSSSEDKTKYLLAAVNGECLRVAMATPGNRNNALNHAAFTCGTMASWPEMVEQTVRNELYQAGMQVGLNPVEVLATINSGWAAGAAGTPKARPVSAEVNGVPRATFKPSVKLTIGLDQVAPEKVSWVWENRVAHKFIAIFAGRSGQGKSFVTCDLVARLSRGDAPPFSEIRRPPMRTLFISEDSPSIVIGPRLLELGAVPSMVRFMTFEAMAGYQISNIEMLTAAYEECGRPELLVIDPPANFLGGVDEHKNAEVRNMLFLLVSWLEKYNVACILITHINKQVGKGLEAVERIIGSVAWGSSARMTVAFQSDPDNLGQFLCGGTKNNLGEKADVLEYRVVKTDSLAKIEWIGKSDASMEDAMNSIKKKSKGANAVEWLEGLFRERREWESDELRRMSREVGVTKYALFESPEVLALPIKKRKRINANGEQYWVWIADDGWPKNDIGISESSESSNVNTVATLISEIPNGDSGRDEIKRIFGRSS